MANSAQAKKRIRQTERKTEVNRRRVSRIRTFVKKVDTAIEAGDKKAAEAAFAQAKPEIDRGVTKGVYKRTPHPAKFPACKSESTHSLLKSFC